jgi:formate dehydrogenase subunit gamma
MTGTAQAAPVQRRSSGSVRGELGMTMLSARIRFFVGALALLFVVTLAQPGSAQQRNPDNSVNPTASSVKEDQLLRELNRVQGRVTLPDGKSGVVEQPAGRDWRQFHQVTLKWIGIISIIGAAAGILIFYLIRGMVRIQAGRSGRVIVRFNAFERFVHWMTATCFVVLAISGLNITFGKNLLLPLLGTFPPIHINRINTTPMVKGKLR